MVNASVVKLARLQIGGDPVGGEGGDGDDFVGEAAAAFGLEEELAFALDADPDGVAEVQEDELERVRIDRRELVKTIEEAEFAFGHGAAVASSALICSGDAFSRAKS